MRSILFMGAIGILVLGLAFGASAEPFVRGSVGASILSDQEVTGENPGGFSYSDFDPENSVAVGAAGGYWFDNFPYLGIEGSIQYWTPDIDEQDNVRTTGLSSTTRSFKAEVDALSFGLIGLVRYPFGPLVPYGGGGLTATHIAFNDVEVNQQDVRADDDLFPTVTVKAGLTWYVMPNLGVFVEYKYINKHFDTTFGRNGSDLTQLDTVEVDMDAQFVEGGVEWRFWDPFAQ